MPPKKKIEYPRYFRSTDLAFRSCVIVFPAEGSMGTAYFADIGQWASDPIWTLADMSQAPEDIEIVRWQAVALGVPVNKPPRFKAEPKPE